MAGSVLINQIMEREVHRLEQLIMAKEQTIQHLTNENKELQNQLASARQDIKRLEDHSRKDFSYQHVPDREIIQTLQSKVATSAWQILQLQKQNTKYQQTIINLQYQLLATQQELTTRVQQLSEVSVTPQINFIEDTSINQIMQQWEETIKQKQLMTDQIFKLKETVKSRQAELADKMGFYLNQVMTLGSKIKQQSQNQKARLAQYQQVLQRLSKENQELRGVLKVKNDQIFLFYQQSKLISTDKASDLHTIRNLRAQIRKKGQQFFKVLSKLRQTEQLKEKLIDYNTQCSGYMGEFNRLSETCQTLKREKSVLQQKLTKFQKKISAKETLIQQTNKKLYELLIENESCHELLYETRGHSNLFTKDVQAKVERFLQKLQKRRQNNQSWLDVSELITINQELRTRNSLNDNL